MPQFDPTHRESVKLGTSDSTSSRVQTYSFTLTAGGANVTPTATTLGRNYLLIQNQGINPLRVQFGKAAADNAANFLIPGGDEYEWAEKVPMESVNLSSVLGTSGVIIEGKLPGVG